MEDNKKFNYDKIKDMKYDSSRGRYDEAYQIYKGNVLDLQNRFVRKLVSNQE